MLGSKAMSNGLPSVKSDRRLWTGQEIPRTKAWGLTACGSQGMVSLPQAPQAP